MINVLPLVIASLNLANAELDMAYDYAVAEENAARIAQFQQNGITAWCRYDNGLVHEMDYSDFLRHEGEIGGICSCNECESYGGCTPDCYDEDEEVCEECGDPECECDPDDGWSRSPRHERRTRASRW